MCSVLAGQVLRRGQLHELLQQLDLPVAVRPAETFMPRRADHLLREDELGDGQLGEAELFGPREPYRMLQHIVAER